MHARQGRLTGQSSGRICHNTSSLVQNLWRFNHYTYQVQTEVRNSGNSIIAEPWEHHGLSSCRFWVVEATFFGLVGDIVVPLVKHRDGAHDVIDGCDGRGRE